MAEAFLLRVGFIHQNAPNGTAHAVMAARNWLLESGDSDVLIVPADLPLVRPEALRTLVRAHRRRGSVASVLSAEVKGRAFGSPLARGLKPRASTAAFSTPGFAVLIREANEGRQSLGPLPPPRPLLTGGRTSTKTCL